ncbi:MAG: hypothetical protein GW855_06315 [Erythrobacter sp.]|nr:hypothetical protein [Erythrobacter sp.]NCQ64552.1 hypothetical protein [Alphaproteobacteria bacterium]
MFGIVGLLVLLVVVALLAMGFAFILDVTMPRTGWKSRAIAAALLAAFLPMSLPAFIIVFTQGYEPEVAIILAVLSVGTLVLAALVGFPVAYFFSRKRAARRAQPDAAKDFD